MHDFEHGHAVARAGARSDGCTSLVTYCRRDGEERTTRCRRRRQHQYEEIICSRSNVPAPPFALSRLFGIDPEGVIVAGIAPGRPR